MLAKTSNVRTDGAFRGVQAVLIASALASALVVAPLDAKQRPMLRDAAMFAASRDQCDHFRGEEPYGAARARKIAAKVKRYCTGTDRELRRLRKKYAHNPRVLQRLSVYEETVE